MISHIYYAVLIFFGMLPKVLRDKVEHSRGCTSYSALRKDTATHHHCLETIQVCHCFAFYTCAPASISVFATLFTTTSPYADLVVLRLLPTVLPLPPRAVVIPMCWHTWQWSIDLVCHRERVTVKHSCLSVRAEMRVEENENSEML